MSSLPPPNQDDDDEQNVERPAAQEAEELVEDAAVATTATTPQSFNDLPLDWTNLGIKADDAMPLRYPHDVADWSLDDLDICIVGTAGQKITQIPKDFYKYCHPQLETLILRSHMISVLRGFEGLKHLDTLELYDNQVQALDCLEGPGPNLRVLDISYNSIRDMTPVSLCPNLQELYLANNKLKSIAGLSSLVHLKKIDLGANRIRVLDERELGGLVNLEELWIGKNKIEEIRGLEKLTKLRRLDIQSNRLTKLENLTTQSDTLEELYLAHNAIDDDGASCDTGLALAFPNLNVVDLSRNRLTSTKPFAHLPALEELWISGNEIATFEDIEPLKVAAAAGIQSLDTIYLEYNPVAQDFEYRKRLKEYMPNLSQIDATMIGGIATAVTGMLGARPSAAMVATGVGSQPSAALTAQMTPEQLQQAVLDRARQQAMAKE